MPLRYDNILETVGNTPIVRLNKIVPEHVNLYAKIESFNPGGSVKDRLALGVIEDAEKSGALKPGQTVIEATSGNTGIGLAMVCAYKGYPLVVTMAESFSIERRKMMRFLGARVVLTPAALKGSGMLAKAVELAAKHGWFLVRQLKKESPNTRVIVCEPDNAPILGSGIPQERLADGMPKDSHPLFRPHLMQGWSPDFIPKLTEDVVDAKLIDAVLPINGDDALRLSKALAADEGIFVGISAGATLAGAIAIAEQAEPGANILCMLPDTGERYLSTPLFEHIPADMTSEEEDISRSTPNYRFDAPPPAPPDEEAEEEIVEAPPDALAFLDEATHDPDNPVVLFALEWCEFCWSVRKMFAKYEIPYRSIDLDSVAYQEDNKGGKIRAAILERTGLKTIPQIYISGEHVGGATELFDACNDGSMVKLLEKSNVSWNKSVDTDPYSFLPGWLQSR
jgi:cysteine synthase A